MEGVGRISLAPTVAGGVLLVRGAIRAPIRACGRTSRNAEAVGRVRCRVFGVARVAELADALDSGSSE